MQTIGWAKPILKSGTRILRAEEAQGILDGCFSDEGRIKFRTLLRTGLRYVEAQRFQLHPEWTDGRFIYLPEEAVGKQLRRQLERWVRLTPAAAEDIKEFMRLRPLPTWEAWGRGLKRWAQLSGMDPIGLSPKTTRKTWEAWLTLLHPERQVEISMNQGHTTGTAMKYYLNLPFLEEERERIKPWIEGYF